MNKKTGIRIVASGRALPSENISNGALKAYMDTDDEWIYKRTGIKSRGFCNPQEEDQISLAVEAAQKAIDKAKASIHDFDVNDIGAVLVTSCSSVYPFLQPHAWSRRHLVFRSLYWLTILMLPALALSMQL